ncbi:hypothetical protein BDP55DRAFT_119859 [Colletotrichum godetiae]|uniref:Uncharacterized protein n=1 Tax=Colletotrichum godetiae TaxID=1209918 RepID=A0AAJ0ALD9_9PEZI|nr:uncharacterized protein BDP55DRAFT_119859 [Colletotrichum godetiae]KAK1676053.1 hypothetical protein BDP55DRAFT_119859 [Colletotrichum godetiae]
MGARDCESPVPILVLVLVPPWCRGCLDFPHLLEGSMKNVISCRARRCFRPTRRYCFERWVLTFFLEIFLSFFSSQVIFPANLLFRDVDLVRNTARSGSRGQRYLVALEYLALGEGVEFRNRQAWMPGQKWQGQRVLVQPNQGFSPEKARRASGILQNED